MDNFKCAGAGKVTTLRGAALAVASAPAASADWKFAPRNETGRSGLAPTSEGKTSIYGVPISAVQHCCGRGCKHCQIYWHRTERTGP
jgi:hypothetical protein